MTQNFKTSLVKNYTQTIKVNIRHKTKAFKRSQMADSMHFEPFISITHS